MLINASFVHQNDDEILYPEEQYLGPELILLCCLFYMFQTSNIWCIIYIKLHVLQLAIIRSSHGDCIMNFVNMLLRKLIQHICESCGNWYKEKPTRR